MAARGARNCGAVLLLAAAAPWWLGCAAFPTRAEQWQNLLSPDAMTHWHPTPTYASAPPWTLADGVYGGQDSWVAYDEAFGDFVLECEFLFSGKVEGGIVIRGDATSAEPWKSGYELDIDWAPDREHGHIHFPVLPEPYVGQALFRVGEWHAVRIQARRDRVAVTLDGRDALRFENGQFARGQIILEGHADGVKYRNLRVQRLAP